MFKMGVVSFIEFFLGCCFYRFLQQFFGSIKVIQTTKMGLQVMPLTMFFKPRLGVTSRFTLFTILLSFLNFLTFLVPCRF